MAEVQQTVKKTVRFQSDPEEPVTDAGKTKSSAKHPDELPRTDSGYISASTAKDTQGASQANPGNPEAFIGNSDLPSQIPRHSSQDEDFLLGAQAPSPPEDTRLNQSTKRDFETAVSEVEKELLTPAEFDTDEDNEDFQRLPVEAPSSIKSRRKRGRHLSSAQRHPSTIASMPYRRTGRVRRLLPTFEKQFDNGLFLLSPPSTPTSGNEDESLPEKYSRLMKVSLITAETQTEIESVEIGIQAENVVGTTEVPVQTDVVETKDSTCQIISFTSDPETVSVEVQTEKQQQEQEPKLARTNTVTLQQSRQSSKESLTVSRKHTFQMQSREPTGNGTFIVDTDDKTASITVRNGDQTITITPREPQTEVPTLSRQRDKTFIAAPTMRTLRETDSQTSVAGVHRQVQFDSASAHNQSTMPPSYPYYLPSRPSWNYSYAEDSPIYPRPVHGVMPQGVFAPAGYDRPDGARPFQGLPTSGDSQFHREGDTHTRFYHELAAEDFPSPDYMPRYPRHHVRPTVLQNAPNRYARNAASDLPHQVERARQGPIIYREAVTQTRLSQEHATQTPRATIIRNGSAGTADGNIPNNGIYRGNIQDHATQTPRATIIREYETSAETSEGDGATVRPSVQTTYESSSFAKEAGIQTGSSKESETQTATGTATQTEPEEKSTTVATQFDADALVPKFKVRPPPIVFRETPFSQMVTQNPPVEVSASVAPPEIFQVSPLYAGNPAPRRSSGKEVSFRERSDVSDPKAWRKGRAKLRDAFVPNRYPHFVIPEPVLPVTDDFARFEGPKFVVGQPYVLLPPILQGHHELTQHNQPFVSLHATTPSSHVDILEEDEDYF